MTGKFTVSPTSADWLAGWETMLGAIGLLLESVPEEPQAARSSEQSPASVKSRRACLRIISNPLLFSLLDFLPQIRMPAPRTASRLRTTTSAAVLCQNRNVNYGGFIPAESHPGTLTPSFPSRVHWLPFGVNLEDVTRASRVCFLAHGPLCDPVDARAARRRRPYDPRAPNNG